MNAAQLAKSVRGSVSEGVMTRVRGVLGTATSWGTTWAAGSAALHAVAALLGVSPAVSEALLPSVLTAGLMGGSGGAVFAGGVIVSEGRKRLKDVRVLSGAVWGLLAGIAAPGAIASVLGELTDYLAFMVAHPAWLGTFLVFGAASGSAMIAVAKRAEAQELESGEARPKLLAPTS